MFKKYYKKYKNKTKLIILLSISVILIVHGVVLSNKRVKLTPANKSDIPLEVTYSVDSKQKSGSKAKLTNMNEEIKLDFTLSNTIKYPYVGIDFNFLNSHSPQNFVDLSDFSMISFSVICSSETSFIFSLYSLDSGSSVADDYMSYRKASTHFDCIEQAQQKHINLSLLSIPQWWLDHHGLSYTNQDYDLEKVPGIQIASSTQTPVGTLSTITISDVVLKGWDWSYLQSTIFLNIGLWLFVYIKNTAAYIRYIVKRLRRQNFQAMKSDVQLEKVTESLLSNQEADDKHTDQSTLLLDALAKAYTRLDMRLELLAKITGLNRNKINNILKQETGMTFNVYLNKLRLDEAARLLRSNGEYRISVVAHAVGYKNVSYFNRAFKETFGCTPNEYRTQEFSDK